jgi:hypothetical protein
MIFFYLFTLHFKVLSNLDTFADRRTLDLTKDTFADRRTLDLTKDTFAYQRTLNLTNNPSILQRVLNILLDTAQLLNSHKYERSQKN